MKPKGIVLSGQDKAVEAKAASLGLPVTVDDGLPLAYGKTLFVKPGTRVPWDLLSAGWHFLERWDAAVPLWSYKAQAGLVGSKEEQKRTREVVGDLRVMLYAVELLFVRANEDGQALMAAYWAELEDSQEPRLAFLRAYYRTKPRLCVLPLSWLAEVQARAKQDLRSGGQGRMKRSGPMVQVEVEPGRFVKCHKGDEQAVIEQYAQRAGRRRG